MIELPPIERHNLNDLNPAPYNPRTITQDEFSGLKESIKAFSMVELPIWNKQTGNIVSGHQRYEAAKQLGYSELDVVVVDLNDKQEKKLNVEMNNQAISGKYDDLKLAEILEILKLDDDYDSLRLNKLEELDLSRTHEINEEDMSDLEFDNILNNSIDSQIIITFDNPEARNEFLQEKNIVLDNNYMSRGNKISFNWPLQGKRDIKNIKFE